MCTPTNCTRPFGPDGCQVPIGNGVCGEKRTLEFIDEFKRLYERKMEEIDANGGGDCTQEKLRLQQEWIENLIEQNEMLVRAVGELEVEATERVHMLEDKLQKSAQCICEEERKVKKHESTIEELRKRIDYFDSFGNIEGMAKDLKCKTDECESLRQTCLCHKNEALSLKSKIEELLKEKLCLECDLKQDKKQIVDLESRFHIFLKTREDLKQKFNATERECRCLQEKNQQLEKENDAFKSKVEVVLKDNEHYVSQKILLETEVKAQKEYMNKFEQTMGSCLCKIEELEKENKKLTEELIQLNEENRNLMQSLDGQNCKLHHTAKLTQEEVLKLHATIDELQNNLQRTKELQDEEEKIKGAEIFRLKETIQNLRKNLKETEDRAKICKICKGRSKIGFAHSTEVQATLDQEQIQKQIELLQHRDEIIKVQTDTLTLLQNELKNLKERDYDMRLESEKQYNEINLLRNRIGELENELKVSEEKAANLQLAQENKQCKNQLKKLQKQKKCYEEVVSYFREEMTIMADQLHNLQELLTLSHASIHQENSKLQKAFSNVQSTNDHLSCQLKAAEQKLLLENQMNQLNESKICELEKLISDKELDLGRHDHAILNIRKTLQCSLKQNEELHGTIVALNSTILKLQGAIKKYDSDNTKSKEYSTTCQEQINSCKVKLQELKESLERKTTELCKLEMAYNNQNRSLKSAQIELKEMKEKQREKQCNLKCIMGEMDEKLKLSEQKYNKLMDGYKKMETQLGILTRRESIKQVEIQRYRQIVVDLKKTLINLNSNLTKKDFKPKCQNESCGKYLKNPEETDQDLSVSCPCEVEFYHSIVESLTKSVTDLQKKLNETEKINSQLEEKCKFTEARVAEMSKNQIEKDKEYNELRQKLNDKLRLAQQEESRYLELAGQFERELGSIRQELEVRTLQLNDVKKSAQEINSSRCVQLACAQEEVNRLKDELNKLLRKHCALNVENERLHSQGARLQSTVTNLEEKSQLLTGQLEQYLMELQAVQTEKEGLVQKNRELLTDLRSIQNCYATANKQHRELHLHHSTPKSQRPCINNIPVCIRGAPSPPPMCQSPWSLGSQGTTSYQDDSPSHSPSLNEECDWYSSNFRNYSEEEEGEDDEWVNKVEDLAAQVRRTNKMWKNKLSGSELAVTKDTKK